MQLTPRHYQETSGATPGDAPAAPSTDMADYEARRCVVCNGRYPSFGFGPPLQTGGRVIWSCRAHRDEVDRSARGVAISPADREPRLL